MYPERRSPTVLAMAAAFAMAVTSLTAQSTSRPTKSPETPEASPASSAESSKPSEKRKYVDIRVDPRVELFSGIFRFAGSPEYRTGRVKSYANALDKAFAKQSKHPVFAMARKLRATQGISYDAVMSLAIHVTDTKTFDEFRPLDPLPPEMDKRWTTASARAFLASAKDFAKKVDFDSFLARNDGLYAKATIRLTETFHKHADLAWFDRFYGKRPDARFFMPIGLLNGGSCYGPRRRHPDGSEELFSVLGVWMTDKSGDPRFDESVMSTIIHEFSHSYCNPLVERHLAKFEKAGKTIFKASEEAMRRQAYGRWDTVVKESMVRACVARYMGSKNGQKGMADEIRENVDLGFLWIEGLVHTLGEYEKNREKYPTLDAFIEPLVQYFDLVAKSHDALPKVTKIFPADGSKSVDPATTSLTIVFDRPMAPGQWSFVRGNGKFPKIVGAPSYDKAHKVLTMKIALEPGTEYEYWLNSKKHSNFRSRDGHPLLPLRVRFATKSPEPVR